MTEKRETGGWSAVIQLAGVNKHFGQLHVLKEINLRVKSGEKVVVIGPSGSGKSTLIRCMNLLERPSSGKITVDGVEITAHKAPVAKVRQSVAMVFQQFNLYPHKTVLQNLTLAPMLIKGVAKAEAEESGRAILDRVGLKAKADAYPAQLSGGQQQRVAIARALNMRPKIMLFVHSGHAVYDHDEAGELRHPGHDHLYFRDHCRDRAGRVKLH